MSRPAVTGAAQLRDVALEAMHRGDIVAVSVGERSFNGVVVHVGQGSLHGARPHRHEVDLLIPALTRLPGAERVPDGGLPLRRTEPERFRHCLFAVEARVSTSRWAG